MPKSKEPARTRQALCCWCGLLQHFRNWVLYCVRSLVKTGHFVLNANRGFSRSCWQAVKANASELPHILPKQIIQNQRWIRTQARMHFGALQNGAFGGGEPTKALCCIALCKCSRCGAALANHLPSCQVLRDLLDIDARRKCLQAWRIDLKAHGKVFQALAKHDDACVEKLAALHLGHDADDRILKYVLFWHLQLRLRVHRYCGVLLRGRSHRPRVAPRA